jgi:nitrogen-specific signal transduction histidine kinase
MKTDKQKLKLHGVDFIEHLGKNSWTYIKTVVDIVREPILILDKELHVIVANEPFYQTFRVEKKDTEDKVIYKLGNGQWNIPELRRLLEDILPKHTFFKGFEVSHNFPLVGKKVMMLNARQIYSTENKIAEPHPPIILLAIEDITEMMTLAQKLSDHTTQFEKDVTEKTEELKAYIINLEKEIDKLNNSSNL